MRLIKLIFLSSFLFILSSVPVQADTAGRFGLGVIVGAPTGVSFKYDINGWNAIDGGLAWALGTRNDFHLHADYLWHYDALFKINDRDPIDLFYGIGARFRSLTKVNDDKTRLGPRIPVGLRHMFNNPDIEVFLEIALIVDLIQKTEADLDFGIGGRFFF